MTDAVDVVVADKLSEEAESSIRLVSQIDDNEKIIKHLPKNYLGTIFLFRHKEYKHNTKLKIIIIVIFVKFFGGFNMIFVYLYLFSIYLNDKFPIYKIVKKETIMNREFKKIEVCFSIRERP